MSLLRTRWAAFGAAVAITLGAGGVGLVAATVDSGSRTVFVPITPCRIMDTRPGFAVGPKTSPVGPQEVYSVDAHGAHGQCTLPSDAAGLVLNVTAVGATQPTFVAVWGDGSRPNASSLNPQPGQPPTPNAVTTDLTDAGKFYLYNNAGSVNVFVDVVGYYADHTHDDRYYTKSQIDARYETGPIGRIVARGTVFGNTVPNFSSDTFTADGVAISVTSLATGRHRIDLTGDGFTDFPTTIITAANYAVDNAQRSCNLGSGSLLGGDHTIVVNCYAGTTLTNTSYNFLIVAETNP